MVTPRPFAPSPLRMLRAALAASLAAIATACSDPSAPGALVRLGSAAPIVGGTFDGQAHPYVGAILYDYEGDGITGTDLLCSGTLISPTVFLTAAHCLEFLPQGSQLYVTFDAQLLDDPLNVSPLIPATSYAWEEEFKEIGLGGEAHDIGVVLLPAGSTTGITPAQLPTEGVLDALAASRGRKEASFVIVGYGVSSARTGQPVFPWNGRRNTVTAPFNALSPWQLNLLEAARATGQGGTCYGDSGSPILLPGTNIVVAVLSWGDAFCRGVSWSYRVDIESTLDFLAPYLD